MHPQCITRHKRQAHTINGSLLGSKDICMKLSILNLVPVREGQNYQQAMAAMVALFAAAVLNFSGRTGAREEETLRKAVARASVQCYAIEGRYPPSVEYLEENYGVQINRKKYNVFYDGFASNVMPEITIIAPT